MLDGLFYYFAGTGVVVGLRMDPDMVEELGCSELLEHEEDE